MTHKCVNKNKRPRNGGAKEIVMKCFSSISYCSKDFLERELTRLTDEGVLKFWAFIEHAPEENEIRVHSHLFVIPCVKNWNSILSYDLVELKPNGNLKTLSFCCSRFNDWYLYSCHSRVYLSLKGQVRKYHYRFVDFVVSNERLFETYVSKVMKKIGRLEYKINRYFNRK
jgi:hypothetical protein